ncbi:hypothetical protein AWH62_01305 [Maricaulis sp. W15]|nr:hypothetical protein AWH62_01305 [Maricaulis sp. W15]
MERCLGDTDDNGIELVKQTSIIQVGQDNKHFRRGFDNKCLQTLNRRDIAPIEQIAGPNGLNRHTFEISQAWKEGRRASKHAHTVHVAKAGASEMRRAQPVHYCGLYQGARAGFLKPTPNCLSPFRIRFHQHEIIDTPLPRTPRSLTATDMDNQAEALAHGL